jgi:hypothetical protein
LSAQLARAARTKKKASELKPRAQREIPTVRTVFQDLPTPDFHFDQAIVVSIKIVVPIGIPRFARDCGTRWLLTTECCFTVFEMKKLRVGILFGGRSGEHEVSLLSAASVLNAIDKQKYEVVPIGITKEGRWLTEGHAERLLRGESAAAESGRHLRAGDPGTTPGAVVLAKGEAVIVPPVPQAHG